MSDVVDINTRRAPVVYDVTISHFYDGTIEFYIRDVADDPRSRDAVLWAFRRIIGAEAIESDLKDAITLARELTICLAATHYPDVPQFKPLESLTGLLSQIDNMTSGLVRNDRIEQLEAALRAVIDWDNTIVVEDGPFLGDVMNIVRKALEGKDE